jgi:hypothetical protein
VVSGTQLIMKRLHFELANGDGEGGVFNDHAIEKVSTSTSISKVPLMIYVYYVIAFSGTNLCTSDSESSHHRTLGNPGKFNKSAAGLMAVGFELILTRKL